jgi:hypothetical protein
LTHDTTGKNSVWAYDGQLFPLRPNNLFHHKHPTPTMALSRMARSRRDPSMCQASWRSACGAQPFSKRVSANGAAQHSREKHG